MHNFVYITMCGKMSQSLKLYKSELKLYIYIYISSLQEGNTEDICIIRSQLGRMDANFYKYITTACCLFIISNSRYLKI